MPGFLERDEASASSPARSTRGTASAACGRSAAWPRPRRLACTETRRAFRESRCQLPAAEESAGSWSRKLEPLDTCFTYPFSAGASRTRAWKWTRSSTSPTGEPIAKVSRANGGLIQRDMRKAQRAPRRAARDSDRRADRPRGEGRRAVRRTATLPMGDGAQTPDEFVRAQSASDRPPRATVPREHEEEQVRAERDAADSRRRSRAGSISTCSRRDYGEERGVPISYQAQSPVLGLVLPSTRPGVHTLWLPVIPMQIGLVLKPGPQEPWTPFRMAEAFFQAGIPREAISVYPGEGDVGAAVLESCGRSLVFGGTPTVDRYRGNPQGPGARSGVLARSCSATMRWTTGRSIST